MMDKKKYKVNVDIFYESYTIKGDVEPAKMMRIAAMLDEHMKKKSQSYPQLSPAKIAVLAALNIVEEYYRLEEDYQELLNMLQKER
jgi:cell division protein ZapA